MRIEKSISFEELKKLFLQNYQEALNAFYVSQRESFFSWSKRKFQLDENTAADVYQDAILALYNAVLENRVDHVKSTPEAYLFGIARNILLKKASRDAKMQYVDDFSDNFSWMMDDDLTQKHQNQEVKDRINLALSKLKENCREIIKLYYYHRYNNESIAETLGYDNTDVVKARKYQCMKELKKIFI